MNPRNDLENLALRDPNKFLEKMGPDVRTGVGAASPVPPGVQIIDNENTRDANYPIDHLKKGNF